MAEKLVPFKYVPGKSLDVAIVKSLTKKDGKARRGLKIMIDRNRGNCLACHFVSVIHAKLDVNNPATRDEYGSQGTLGPSLDDVAKRYSTGELRAILVNPQAAFPNQDTVMPPYYMVGDFVRVIPECKNRAVLSASDIEDVLAYLGTLK
ncbi:MAG: c-type cytochrome [Methyloligellaceae bacterium]